LNFVLFALRGKIFSPMQVAHQLKQGMRETKMGALSDCLLVRQRAHGS
jgi:hypothetical protein